MAKTKKTVVNNTSIDINGLSIKEKSHYKITSKPDSSAPSGYVKEGATKLPSKGIGDFVMCPFVVTNEATGEGVFDTGFYYESPMYRGMDKTEVKAKVDILKKLIVEPFERKMGVGILDHKNETFWENRLVNLELDRLFSTDNIEDLLDLYIAMLGYSLTPKDKLGNPKYRDSAFIIVDREKVKHIRDERAENVMEAISQFSVLLSTDPTLLEDILKYVGLIGVHTKADLKVIKASFFDWINKSEDNVYKFNSAINLANNKKTKDVVTLFAMLNKSFIKGIITKNGGNYTYKGIELGVDLKTVANNLNSRKDLEEIKLEIISAEF